MTGPEQHAATVRHALDSGQWGDVRDAVAALDELVALAVNAHANARLAMAAEARADELQRERDEAQQDRNEYIDIAERIGGELEQARREADQLRAERDELIERTQSWQINADLKRRVSDLEAFVRGVHQTADDMRLRLAARAALAGVQADNKDSA